MEATGNGNFAIARNATKINTKKNSCSKSDRRIVEFDSVERRRGAGEGGVVVEEDCVNHGLKQGSYGISRRRRRRRRKERVANPLREDIGQDPACR